MAADSDSDIARDVARSLVIRFVIVLTLAIVVMQFTQSDHVAKVFSYLTLIPGIGFALLSLHPTLGRIWHALFGAGAVLVSMQVLTARTIPDWLHLIGIVLMGLGVLLWFRMNRARSD